ncbi:aromatic acid exporter family protein [Cohnella nanjingensis]|uniref:Aromatic acid exporter family protein n=1 Tax=Cohnella nanjingensis TaxID=1387779 RepID=A0A7X0RKJ5_9BACL|nr:aromatic acid exporter family protein [Cohnella nanjingensis]
MGLRVMKTAIATLTAIYAAMLLNVDNPQAAGILAILGVDTTRWRGLKTVFARFAASLVGLVIASALFDAIGFHIWVLGLFILIAFPLLTRFGLKEGIVTGSVIVFHLFARGEVSVDAILTELKLLSIGLGWATFFNLVYMPREKRTLAVLRDKTERLFAAVFVELARFLRDPGALWSGDEMLQAEAAIDEGIEVAQRSRENRLIWRSKNNRLVLQDEPWLLYFHMRRSQLESIQLMMELVAFVSHRVPQAESIARLFDTLTDDVRSDYYEGKTEQALDALETQFRAMPLPATRDEFETRAALLQLCRELRRYLTIARREKKRRSPQATAHIQ